MLKRWGLLVSVIMGIVLALTLLPGYSGYAAAQQRPTVTILAFSQGFAWPELFGSTGTERTAALKQLEDEVGANIKIVWGDEAAVRQKTLTDLIGHTGRYDILMVGSDGGVQLYGSIGCLEPLDSYLKDHPTKWFDPKDVYPKFLDANRMPPGGPLYALPYYSFGAGLFYRKDIFDRYGLTPPKTTGELMVVLEKLKEGFARDGITDVYPITMRAAPGEEPFLDLAGFIYAYAGYPAFFEGGAITADQIRKTHAKPILNSEDFKKGFKAYVDILRNYGPPGASTHTWVDMMNLYAAGKAAILMPSAINGYAAVTKTENPNVKKYSRFAKIPTGPSGKQIQSFWTFAVGINKDSKHKLAAWKVLTYLCGKQSAQAFAERTGWPDIAIKSVMHSPVLIKKWGADQVKLNEESILEANPYYFPYIPELEDFATKIGTACSEAVAGQDIDSVLANLQRWALNRMATAGYYK